MTRFSIRRMGMAAGAALAMVAGMSIPGSAHHSTAMFEWGSERVIEDMTVERWVWSNPHTFLYARDSQDRRWAFEGMSPNHLSRAGWSRRTLAPGEKVSVGFYPMRDGRRGGFNVRVFKEDGTEMLQLPSAM
ncbi:DUF6152 family protein [Aurantiacibacter poecillastricola]|uniref:DUF6152 family protein n=1 Tax=Aurantiacibacter poecillastricola TaxID=3064385 RepID=UPI00273D1A04|nr:DUF6152 family protein [Aurantiacibacter sp. 219JJ12-13]MDP5260583.1 DUF6152 family protein [Aurantiacibacter sp. 219JJ12-13]